MKRFNKDFVRVSPFLTNPFSFLTNPFWVVSFIGHQTYDSTKLKIKLELL